jgi:hypothetical protein
MNRNSLIILLVVFVVTFAIIIIAVVMKIPGQNQSEFDSSEWADIDKRPAMLMDLLKLNNREYRLVDRAPIDRNSIIYNKSIDEIAAILGIPHRVVDEEYVRYDLGYADGNSFPQNDSHNYLTIHFGESKLATQFSLSK